MTQPKKWGHIPTPWLFDEIEMKIKGVNIFNDHKIIADVSDTLLGASNIITQINNAERIVECVNAMEGIIDPIAFIEQYNESKRTKLILTQEELQKLGEQYKNQEETPYIEITTCEKVRQKHTGAASEFIGLTVKRDDTKSIDDRIVIILDEYAQKMQDKIDHYFSIYADKANRYDFVKKLILEILERVEKSPVTLQENGAIYNVLKKVIQ